MKIRPRKFILSLSGLVAGLALVTAAASLQAASFRPEKRVDGAVVATSRFATEAGMQVLKAGGNAIDAAVCVGYTMAVTHPVAGNLGGGGFAVIRTA
nr:gamma-glutamyltransferase [Desulfobacterales bacterium]